MGLVTKYPTIGAKITEQYERPKLLCVDFICDRGPPALWVEAHVLSKVLTSSLRLASRGWIIFRDLLVCQSCSEVLVMKSTSPSVVFFLLIIVGVESRIIFDDPRPIFV